MLTHATLHAPRAPRAARARSDQYPSARRVFSVSLPSGEQRECPPPKAAVVKPAPIPRRGGGSGRPGAGRGRKSQATKEAEKARLAQFMADKYGASGSRLAAQMGGA